MLKVRIYAAVLAIVLTLMTIYVVPRITFAYISFTDGLSPDQRTWFGIFQATLGFLIAFYSLWLWKKKKSKDNNQS